MNDIPLKQIIDAALSNIGSVADVNTVIGEPLTLPTGVTVIPFSKVSVGFASGGADYAGKKPEDTNVHFAGGNGAGISVTPLGFVIINGSDVRVVDLNHPTAFTNPPADPVNKALDSISALIDKTPELIDKIKVLIKKKENSSDESETPAETGNNENE